MNDDRHNARQQCPARPDDGGHALAFVVGGGCRKSGRSVSARYQSDNLRRGLYSLFANRGSGGGIAESNVGPRSNPLRGRIPRGEVFSGLSATRGNEAITASRLFNRCPRGGCRVSSADPRCPPLSQLLSRPVVDPPCLNPPPPPHLTPPHIPAPT